ncbi:MAG: glycosyl hydrolase [Bacteroidia bacterium]|nr:glycosyl hydrolase [Bacteroidia bacterium]
MSAARRPAASRLYHPAVTALARRLRPAHPHASPEARRLLALLYLISGNQFLSGQHNPPAWGSRWSEAAAALGGHYPALWGQDLGFSAPGTHDGIDFRQANLDEAIRQHRRGAVICFTWHAVCPLDEEPVAFEGGIQRQIPDAQWRALLTPGTRLHRRWLAQTDAAARCLRVLKRHRVPVLWRPYHEMNGAWFWWGGRPGPADFVRLWRNLYHRFIHVHRLDHLVWVWNPNGPYHSAAPHEAYFPGHRYADVLALDIYHSQFDPAHYEGLLRLAAGKPVALGEVGALPSPEVLAAQPRWAWLMAWGDLIREANTPEQVRAVYALPQALHLPDGNTPAGRDLLMPRTS